MADEIEARIRALILEAAAMERVIEDRSSNLEIREIAVAARADMIQEAADLRRKSRRTNSGHQL